MENVNESEQQKTNEDYPLSCQINASVPNDVPKTQDKPEVNSNLALNSALPLRLIHVSRILKGIPQSPHFLHLRKYSDLAQEKLVATWDQIFEEAVEQVQAPKTKDFWVMANKLWKTMEGHGIQCGSNQKKVGGDGGSDDWVEAIKIGECGVEKQG